MKKCSKCQTEKSLDSFSNNRTKNDGKATICKVCFSKFYKSKPNYKSSYYLKNKSKISEQQKVYYKENLERRSELSKNYRERNRETLKLQKKIYYQLNKSKIIEASKNWRIKNEEKARELDKLKRQRYRLDPIVRLKDAIRRRLHKILKGKAKSQKTLNILGCSFEEFKNHLQSLFKPGMTWENYGSSGWHIDHKIPLASATTEEELYKLNHFSNLQPLWAEENFKKGSKIV